MAGKGASLTVGILTGGGDCPGLNAVIRAVVMKGQYHYGDSFVGFRDGWRGVLENEAVPLTADLCADLVATGGTMLGTSRTNPYARDDGLSRIEATFAARQLDALIAIGGEDTLGVGARLSDAGYKVVGVPKTIDNDLPGSEMTFGFDTAVQVATEAIDRLRTTAESHHRVIVCEVMGRNAGWIAAFAGIAGGAAEVIVPERPFDIEEVCRRLQARHEAGHFSSVVVVAEGAVPRPHPGNAGQVGPIVEASGVDEFGHARLGGVGAQLAADIERITGFESRVTILGHIQRGGTPTAFDRVLATRFGVAAIDGIHDGAFGVMVSLRCGRIERVPIVEVTRGTRHLEAQIMDEVVEPMLVASTAEAIATRAGRL